MAGYAKSSALIDRPKHWGVLFLAGTLLFSPAAAADVVERILAVVNDELVLLTDLERDRVFCPGPESMTSLVTSAVSDQPYPGLQALINKRLIVSEARRLNISLPSERMVEESRKALIERFGGLKSLSSAMAAHGVHQQDILAMLREHLLIRRFLEVRIFPFIRTPTAEDPGAATSRSSRDATRNARASERLDRYLARLRAGATIEINPPL